MGKKTTSAVNKNKEKRQARKLEQRRIADGMALVNSANKLQDIASHCKGLLEYRTRDMEVDMYIQRVTELDKDVLDWAINLTEKNMKILYETCAWGWNQDRKVEEMTEDAAWYVVAKQKNGPPLAFSHFRFDMDFGEPVVYCYEVQVVPDGRRRGLGLRVLTVLEKLAQVTSMRFVRLTVLTHNPAATAFFKACGYIIDETSPPKDEAAHYEILSKEIPTNTESTSETEIKSDGPPATVANKQS